MATSAARLLTCAQAQLPRIIPGHLGAAPYMPGSDGDHAWGTSSPYKGATVYKQCITLGVASSAVVGLLALSPTPASASSPNPASSCAGQLNQGATPHGLSAAEPGFLGSFVSGLATSGGATYGTVASSLAGGHGDLFTCIATVPMGG